MTKYLKHTGGATAIEVMTISTSTGAAQADQIVATNTQGVLDPTLLNAATTGNSKVLLTDATGRIDPAVLPVGTGQDTNSIQASEALTAGDVVNVHTVSGASRVRKADATTGKEGHGFVLSSVASGNMATVFFEGTNTQVSGLTAGGRVYLGTTPGAVTSTTPTGAGVTAQIVGVAVSATAYNFQFGMPIIQA